MQKAFKAPDTGTVDNLDVQRPVVWNMGEIALSPGHEAVTLFRQVLLASVSIPRCLPAGQHSSGGRWQGARRTELHVDGGTTRKVFIAQISLRSLEPFYSAPKPARATYLVLLRAR